MGMEVQVRHSTIGERKSSISGSNSGSVSAIQSEGGGSGDDSSIDEPQPISLKKSLKNGKEPNNNVLPSGSSGVLDDERNGSCSDMINDDHQRDDDECSGPSMKEGGVSTSFTSGENSDAECGDNEDIHGVNLKQEDSRKCFECDVCNMTFSNGANMRRHRMRHTGVKPYECRVCQKRFFRKDHLAEHMATHSKLLPFRCPICNKGFQRQIAMRAHFQNEHVGGSHDMVKACPLCAYKAGSMKSLRVHFRTRHGIDLDNPMPHSSGLSSGTSSGSPGPTNGEYSELAQALGFEDREKLSESMIPSHFLVPQIEISSNNSSYPYYSFSADSSYSFAQDERSNGHRSSSPANVSPQSDSSSNLPSSSDLVSVVVKKEIVDEHSLSNGETKDLYDKEDDIQDMPEDLSSGSGNSTRNAPSPKCCSSTFSKVSPLKSLLREEWKKDSSQNSGSVAGSSALRSRSDSSSHSNGSGYQPPSYEGEAISSSIGMESGSTHSLFSRRGGLCPSPLHQCVFCGIIFPDKTLYFLHKGCHSESNPWKCNICGECCSNVYDFNSHLLSKSHQ